MVVSMAKLVPSNQITYHRQPMVSVRNPPKGAPNDVPVPQMIFM